MKGKNNITLEDLGELRQQEIDLLWIIRHEYRFGSIEILVRDGIPIDLLRTIERTRLGTGDISTDGIDKQKELSHTM